MPRISFFIDFPSPFAWLSAFAAARILSRAAASALFLRLLYHFPRRLTTSHAARPHFCAFPAFFLGKALASFARICYNKFSFFTGPQDARFFVCFAAKNRDAKGAVCL
ncbi:MAG: hypothetical protein ACLRH1_10150 [Acutalibacteraceae bacterium]